ncbi:MAG TPA: acyl-CoA dehydrogenase family protein [Bryobacteraceae bacterium]|nr:acyl-CoA dehydrogenase family protein [Bryobacteraceae bacterium]
MKTFAQRDQESLDRICRDCIAPAAATVDRTGQFPNLSIQSLKSAGLLGAISSPGAGGLGMDLGGAAAIVKRVAEECGSTAMVLCMHYCGAAVLEAYAPMDVRRAVAAGQHLSTLAFSESGSRSHFWAPQGTAAPAAHNGHVSLNARKSWVTSASYATAYIWSSQPLEAEGIAGNAPSTLWLVPAGSPGLSVQGPFEGLGLRGNDSCPISADDVRVPRSAMLGADGKGFEIMMGTVLPAFAILSAACSVGFMKAASRRTVEHATRTRHADTGCMLAGLPTIRNCIARMRIKTDMAGALLDDTVEAVRAARPDARLRVLECKACASEAANEVLDLAMRVCGGAGFRKDLGIERYFRDTRAAGVMAPTTDALYDFIGKSLCGLPLFE